MHFFWRRRALTKMTTSGTCELLFRDPHKYMLSAAKEMPFHYVPNQFAPNGCNSRNHSPLLQTSYVSGRPLDSFRLLFSDKFVPCGKTQTHTPVADLCLGHRTQSEQAFICHIAHKVQRVYGNIARSHKSAITTTTASGTFRRMS